eukprot:s2567_g7.t1
MREDGKPVFAFSQDELENLESYGMALDDFGEHDDDDAFVESPTSDVELLLREVTYPYTKDEPNVSSDELQRLDAVADRIEMIRLKGLGVLCDPCLLDGVEYKTLSTRFVRTWRRKNIDGAACWLRRSRFVAREFAWLSESKKNLFSPASSAIAYRIIPTMFLKHQPAWGLYSIDIKDALLTVLIPCLKAKYSIAVDSIEAPGDEISFLKRSHVLLGGGKMLIRSHHKHFSQLQELLSIGKKYYAKKSPSHPKIDDIDDSAPLSDQDAPRYRSAVGTLLYLAPDHPQCQHAIRFLATQMSAPTQHAWQVLKHLVLYMLGHQDVCLSLNFAGDASGVFHEYTGSSCGILEVFTDADCGASKMTRCSISACAIFYGKCLFHSASRTQRVVALSSAESEIYSAASGVCDAILVRRILCWMIGEPIATHLYLDSAAARGIMARRGVGKIRHLSCRCLWLQALVASKDFTISPIAGTKNPADLGTKR